MCCFSIRGSIPGWLCHPPARREIGSAAAAMLPSTAPNSLVPSAPCCTLRAAHAVPPPEPATEALSQQLVRGEPCWEAPGCCLQPSSCPRPRFISAESAPRKPRAPQGAASACRARRGRRASARRSEAVICPNRMRYLLTRPEKSSLIKRWPAGRDLLALFVPA